MIEQQAKVIRSDDTFVWVEAERKSTCSGCKVKQGCGTGLLANHVGKKFSQIRVEKTHDVLVGAEVKLEIPEETLLQGAVLMYILPLVLMFAFTALMQLAAFGELANIAAGISGLFLGFYWVKLHLDNKKDVFKARISEEGK